jgi:hypothetical protein
MLCRHYDTEKGCQMGEKCGFAHGTHELRSLEDVKYIYDYFSLYHHKLIHIILCSKF